MSSRQWFSLMLLLSFWMLGTSKSIAMGWFKAQILDRNVILLWFFFHTSAPDTCPSGKNKSPNSREYKGFNSINIASFQGISNGPKSFIFCPLPFSSSFLIRPYLLNPHTPRLLYANVCLTPSPHSPQGHQPAASQPSSTPYCLDNLSERGTVEVLYFPNWWETSSC